MIKQNLPILYIKSGCPWCHEALNFFSAQGIDLDIRDVNKSAKYMSDMVALTAQTKTPTFSYDDFVVSDFDIKEFLAALKKSPKIHERLGFKDCEN